MVRAHRSQKKLREKQNTAEEGYTISGIRIESNAVKTYVVEKIIKKRRIKGQNQYRIKWQGFGNKHNTWEPEHNILDKTVIRSFEEETLRASHRKLEQKQTGEKSLSSTFEENTETNSTTITDSDVSDHNRSDHVEEPARETVNCTSALSNDAVIEENTSDDNWLHAKHEPTVMYPSKQRLSSSPKCYYGKRKIGVASDESVASKIQCPPLLAVDAKSKAANEQVDLTTTRDIKSAEPQRDDDATVAENRDVGKSDMAYVAASLRELLQFRSMLIQYEPQYWLNEGLCNVVFTEVTVDSKSVIIQECNTDAGFFKSVSESG